MSKEPHPHLLRLMDVFKDTDALGLDNLVEITMEPLHSISSLIDELKDKKKNLSEEDILSYFT